MLPFQVLFPSPIQDQYEFIHKVVLEFLTTFDNYDNFK